MSKLFEVPAEPREVAFKLKSYKQNRICNKLLDFIKRDAVWAVKRERRKDPENCRIFIVSKISTDTIQDTANSLKNEIISYIPDAFTPNYQFDFTGNTLGFVRSFEVLTQEDDLLFVCYHNIKEVRTKGESIMPDPQDQIKI